MTILLRFGSNHASSNGSLAMRTARPTDPDALGTEPSRLVTDKTGQKDWDKFSDGGYEARHCNRDGPPPPRTVQSYLRG